MKAGTFQAKSKHLGILAALCLTTTGCGYSEKQWQAQLDKYNALAAENQATQDELDKAKARVAKLEAELQAMGYKLDEEGEANKQLNEALEEYKARAAALERIKERFEKLRKKLEELTKLGLKIQIRKNRMVISLPGDVLFASGRAELQDKGKEILGKVATVIRDDSELAKRTYQVAGHTDDEKIQSAYALKEFKDNWGLSLMRARTVLLFLINPTDDEKDPGGGLDRNLWSASGYGDTDPVASNDGKFGRQKNRRVELIMMPNVEEMLDLKSLVNEPVNKDDDKESSKGTNTNDAKNAKSHSEEPAEPSKKEATKKETAALEAKK